MSRDAVADGRGWHLLSAVSDVTEAITATGSGDKALGVGFTAAEGPHWPAHLSLDYRRDPNSGRTVLRDRHCGPLRVLKGLYPEGDGICHTVLVHPPGGIAGGDQLVIDARVGAHAHALVTTPGATRFYRSEGAPSRQALHARASEGSRMEWLPLETLVHPGAVAENRLRFDLDAGAETIGWDVVSLGLPASARPFDRGRLTQCIAFPGIWLERAVIDGGDTALLDSPLGWAGSRVLATAWFVTATPLSPTRRDALLTAGRDAVSHDPAMAANAGLTSPDARCVVLRALAPHVEAAMRLLVPVWRAWRLAAWDLQATPPRVWRT